MTALDTYDPAPWSAICLKMIQISICATAFFIFSYILAVVNGFNRAGAPSLITAILVGVCIGFLPHNFHPAKIFMGDSGAMLLGLLLAASAITLTGQIDLNAISQSSSRSTLLPLLLPFNQILFVKRIYLTPCASYLRIH